MIYQLAKTSTLLTGQVKWDLVMNKDKVTNLQIVPISEHIPYNYNAPVDVMNYSHGDNVKQLYHKIQGDFYDKKGGSESCRLFYHKNHLVFSGGYVILVTPKEIRGLVYGLSKLIGRYN